MPRRWSYAFQSQAQVFLDFALSHYVTEGVEELDQRKLAPLPRLKYHAISDALAELGDVNQVRGVFSGFQKYLYQDVA